MIFIVDGLKMARFDNYLDKFFFLYVILIGCVTLIVSYVTINFKMVQSNPIIHTTMVLVTYKSFLPSSSLFPVFMPPPLEMPVPTNTVNSTIMSIDTNQDVLSDVKFEHCMLNIPRFDMKGRYHVSHVTMATRLE